MSHILLVEDEVVIRSALCRLLERHGHEVSEVFGQRDWDREVGVDRIDCPTQTGFGCGDSLENSADLLGWISATLGSGSGSGPGEGVLGGIFGRG